MAKKLNKLAYDSNLDYRRIHLNRTVVLGAGASMTIPHNLGYVPYFRCWSELYSGEISYFYVDSAQYSFGTDYYNNGIFGFDVTADATNIYLLSYSPTRNVYLRVYE